MNEDEGMTPGAKWLKAHKEFEAGLIASGWTPIVCGSGNGYTVQYAKGLDPGQGRRVLIHKGRKPRREGGAA